MNPRDVKGDGNVVPLDVLAVINELNSRLFSNPDTGLLLERPADATFYYDVNGDGFATPLDALNVINFLNSGGGEGEGQGESSPDDARAMFAYLLWNSRSRREAPVEPGTGTRLGRSLARPLPRPPIEPRRPTDGRQEIVVNLESNVDQAFAEEERPLPPFWQDALTV